MKKLGFVCLITTILIASLMFELWYLFGGETASMLNFPKICGSLLSISLGISIGLLLFGEQYDKYK